MWSTVVVWYNLSHSEHRFPAPSSKLCQNWLCRWRGNLYLRAAVHRRGQRPPTGLGTNKTVEELKHAHNYEARPPLVKKREKRRRVPSRFKRSGCYLCWRKQRVRLLNKLVKVYKTLQTYKRSSRSKNNTSTIDYFFPFFFLLRFDIKFIKETLDMIWVEDYKLTAISAPGKNSPLADSFPRPMA